MSRYRRYRSRNYGGYGNEYARRHVEEAREFSRWIGGTDEDVKQYFFNLRGVELDAILEHYGRKHGASAKSYAIQALPRWKDGTTKMSGMIAKRLFELLPPRMPLKKKYELAENVWKHFGPSSSLALTVGPNAAIDRIAEFVVNELDENVSQYNIPEEVQNRFDWLSSGDVRIKEELLNYFRQLQKRLAVAKAKEEIPVLQRQIRDHPDVTKHAKSILQIYKHSVEIWVDAGLNDEIIKGIPRQGSSSFTENSGCLFWLIPVLIYLIFLLFKG